MWEIALPNPHRIDAPGSELGSLHTRKYRLVAYVANSKVAFLLIFLDVVYIQVTTHLADEWFGHLHDHQVQTSYMHPADGL